MQLHERADQLSVRAYVHRHACVDHRLHNRLGKDKKQKDDEIEKADAEEKDAFADLTVVELPYSGDYRQHCSHVGVACRLLKIVGCSG